MRTIMANIQEIPNIVDMSDLNLWIACLLTHQGFLYDHPVMSTKIGSDVLEVRGKKELIEHMSTAMFARILVWGHQTYTLHNAKYFPPDFHYKQDLTGSTEGMLSVKSSKNKKSSNAFVSTSKTNNLPEIFTIQQLLKQSILDLTAVEFSMLQCCMMDLHCLQPWTQPFSKRTKSIYNGEVNNEDTHMQDNETETTPNNATENAAWRHYKAIKASNTKSSQERAKENPNDSTSSSDDDMDNTEQGTYVYKHSSSHKNYNRYDYSILSIKNTYKQIKITIK